MPDEPSSDPQPSPESPRQPRRRSRGSRFAKAADVRDLPPVSGDPAALPSALARFRASSGPKLRIHPLELALLWLIAAHLAFLPWALGTMRPWAQIPSLLLSAASLGLALIPRNYTAEHTGGPSLRFNPLPKLFRFPLFWIGLALLTLVTIQALNPAWEYKTNGKGWWMQAIAHTTWLPSGVSVPFERWGPWRMLIIYSSAWMTACALWIGLTRRRSLQRLFLVLAINGVALAIFGIAQRVLGWTKIFGFVDSPNASFFSSFIYKNHAGAYLFLALTVAAGVGAWYYVRGIRRLEKSNPAGIFSFFVICIAVSVLVSYARGATLVMLVYLCLAVGLFLYFQWKLPSAARSPVIVAALLVVFGLFLKTGMDALRSDLAWDRLRSALSGEDLSVQARQNANIASREMLADTWVKGAGSGSFPFLFPTYQHRHPELKTAYGRPVFWPHAHNDILEIPIELGLAGVLLIAAGFLYWLFVLVRNYAWENPLSLALVLGCLFLVAMAWGDFVFYCPAALITWCALWPAATRWAILEESRGGRA